jgi:hypothetical protein
MAKAWVCDLLPYFYLLSLDPPPKILTKIFCFTKPFFPLASLIIIQSFLVEAAVNRHNMSNDFSVTRHFSTMNTYTGGSAQQPLPVIPLGGGHWVGGAHGHQSMTETHNPTGASRSMSGNHLGISYGREVNQDTFVYGGVSQTRQREGLSRSFSGKPNNTNVFAGVRMRF